MSIENIKKVPAREFKLHFGEFREAALTEPIGVTNHGRIRTVMISAKAYEEFERLKQYDTRKALHPSELDDELKAELEKGYLGRKTPERDHLLD